MKKRNTSIVSIANQKGGVGKSTSVINLAAALCKAGKKVLCCDLDSQGHLSRFLGWTGGSITMGELLRMTANGQPLTKETVVSAVCHHPEGMDYIAADLSLAEADIYLVTVMYREQVLQRLFGQLLLKQYDYLLLDCPPYLGLILTNALVVSNEVIIPVQAQKAALDGLDNLLQIVQNVSGITGNGLKVNGILLTMEDNTNQSKAVWSALCEDYPGLVYQTRISRLVEAADSTARGHSCVSVCNSRVGEQYNALAQELLEREGK